MTTPRPTPQTKPSRRSLVGRILATVLAGVVVLVAMNVLQSGSETSDGTDLTTSSVLGALSTDGLNSDSPIPAASDDDGADADVANPDVGAANAAATAIPTTAPLQLPTATSVPQPAPTAAPTATPAPTATQVPSPTTAPTPLPEPTPLPTAEVAAAPAAEVRSPDPTAVPTLAPTLAPEPTATLVPEPTAVVPTATAVPPTPTVVIVVETPTPVPPTPTPVQTQTVADLENYVLAEINDVRAQAGLGPVALDPGISQISRDWSSQMANGGFFSHRPGPELSALLPAGWREWGENIASAPDIFYAQSTLETSPGHYANMVGNFTHVGIGVHRINGQVWLTQNFVRY